MPRVKIYNTKHNLRLFPESFWNTQIVIAITLVALLFAFFIRWANGNEALWHLWDSYKVSSYSLASFCEKADLSKPVRQPINAFSNIVYLVVALLILKETARQIKNTAAGRKSNGSLFFQFLFGIILLYVFFTSVFYHASLTDMALKFDYSGVFLFALFPTFYLLHLQWRSFYSISTNRLSKKTLPLFFVGYFIIASLMLLFAPAWLTGIITLIIILINCVLAVATKNLIYTRYTHKKYLLTSIVCVFIAVMWFVFDKYKILCFPGSYFQPHSLWNLFIGLGAFCFYLYMREEADNTEYISLYELKKLHWSNQHGEKNN